MEKSAVAEPVAVEEQAAEVTLEEALSLVDKLSPLDQVRLIERVAARVETALQKAQRPPVKSLYGILKGLEITEEDIQQARQEMWGSFPRDDI